MFKKHLRRLPLLIPLVLADFYGVIASIFLLLWLITGEGIFYVNLFINLMPLIIAPAIACILLGALLRKWHTLAFNCLPLIVLIIFYGDTFIPPQPAPETTETIRLLSYNLSDDNHDVDKLETLFQQTDTDIIALQEVSSETLTHLNSYPLEQYPYLSHTSFDANHHGEVVLSRWPILEYTQERPFRSLIETPYGTIALYAVHLPFPIESGLKWGTRKHHINQFNQLLDTVESETLPTLLIGDFNISQVTDDYRRLHASFSDVFRASNWGLGFTYPNSDTIPPVLRIDYIFASPEIIPIESHVIGQGKSDHFPLWAKVTLSSK